jgi:hypothetical protein
LISTRRLPFLLFGQTLPTHEKALFCGVVARINFEPACRIQSTFQSLVATDLGRGKGDSEARHHFRKSYAPREAETVTKNKKAKALRTFEYNGKSVEMWRHIRIGVKPSVSETLRVHFHWDVANKKIVIGHCGAHLDHS